jgi:hypothetical protein
MFVSVFMPLVSCINPYDDNGIRSRLLVGLTLLCGMKIRVSRKRTVETMD